NRRARTFQPDAVTIAANDVDSVRGQRAYTAINCPPRCFGRLVDVRAVQRTGGVLRSISSGEVCVIGAFADSIRRLCSLAAPVVAGRGAGQPVSLLEKTIG